MNQRTLTNEEATTMVHEINKLIADTLKEKTEGLSNRQSFLIHNRVTGFMVAWIYAPAFHRAVNDSLATLVEEKDATL